MVKLFFRAVGDAPAEPPSDISEYRKNKILSARAEEARRVLTAAALVLKEGFASFGIKEADVIYKTAENGKPYAASHPDIHFSLSHSKSMAVAVFSDSPVGVDTEIADREISPLLLKRFLGEKNAELFADNPLLLWVAGEALTKHSGEGILSGRHIIIPPFEGDIARIGDVTLTKYIINGNLVVIASSGNIE